MGSLIKRMLHFSEDKAFNNNVRYYVFNGILLTIVTNLYKPFAQKFLFRLNGTEAHVSLFNALPGLVAVFVIIPGIVYMSRNSNRKRTIAISFFMSRLVILSFAFVPFLPGAIQPIAFVLLTSLMNFPESVSTTALQSFAADVFDEKRRATAIAARNKYSSFVSFINLLILGQIIKVLGTTTQRTIEIYQIFFIIAFLLGIYEIMTFTKLKETNTIQQERIEILPALREVFSNRVFMKFMLCSLLFHFGWQMGWPLFSIYQIKYLAADESWITILGVSSGVVMFFSYSPWEKIIRKRGNQFAIALATFGMAATPVLYAWSPNLYVLMLSGLVMGFFTSGTITVVLNSLLEAAPSKTRLIYVAVHATMTNITLFFAPLVGGYILERSNIYMALYICAFARFVGSFSFFIRQRSSAKKDNTFSSAG